MVGCCGISGLFILGWVRDGFWRILSYLPIRSVSGLVWVIGLICGTGHVSGVVAGFRWFLAYSVLCFLLVLPTPPRSGAGGDLGNIANTALGTGSPRFLCQHCAFPLTLSRPTHIAGGMAMAFVDELFLPLQARPSFLSLC